VLPAVLAYSLDCGFTIGSIQQLYLAVASALKRHLFDIIKRRLLKFGVAALTGITFWNMILLINKCTNPSPFF
jgi:hypothetical protein